MVNDERHKYTHMREERKKEEILNSNQSNDNKSFIQSFQWIQYRTSSGQREGGTALYLADDP